MPQLRTRSRWGALGAAAALVLLSACGTPPSAEEEKAAAAAANALEKTTLRVGTLPIVDTAAVQRAQAGGYFAAEGLTVEMLPTLGGSSALPQLISGDLDLMWSGWTSVVSAQERGLGRFRILAEGYSMAPGAFQVLVIPSGEITTVADLPGRTIAVNTFNSVTELVARTALQAKGVDPAGVRFAEVPFPNMIAALRSGEVGAAVLVEPFITQATAQLGAVSVLDAGSGPMAGLPISGLVAESDFVDQNPNTVTAFERAVKKAQAELADRKAVEETLPSYIPIDASTAARLNLGTWPAQVNPGALKDMTDLMKQHGMLTWEFDVTPLFGPSS